LKKFLGPKIRSLGRDKYPKKIPFLNLFSSISWGLDTGTKGEKVVSTGKSFLLQEK
jgi:hypothetical protein